MSYRQVEIRDLEGLLLSPEPKKFRIRNRFFRGPVLEVLSYNSDGSYSWKKTDVFSFQLISNWIWDEKPPKDE